MSFEYNWKSLLNNDKDINLLVDHSNKKIIKDFNKLIKSEEKNKIIQYLLNNTYELERLYSLSRIIPIINNNVEINKLWINSRDKIEQTIKKINENTLIPKKLLWLKTQDLSNEESMIINKILEKYKKNGIYIENDKVYKIQNSINQILRDINKKLEKGYMSNILKFNVNFYNFENINRELYNNSIRINVLNEFFSNYNLLNDLVKTILFRYEFNKNYFSYRNPNINLEDIKLLIINLLNDFKKTNVIVNDVNLIKKQLEMSKISFFDAKTLCNFINKDILFVPNDIVKNMIGMFENIFKIKIIINNKLEGWDENIIVLEIYHNNQKIGLINLDLLDSKNKYNDIKAFFITPKTSYPYNQNSSVETANIILVSKFKSLIKPSININQIQLLYQEFMKSIIYCFQKNTYGLDFIGNDEYDIFVKYFIQEVIFNENHIKKICYNDQNIMKKLKSIHYTYSRLELFQNLIDSLFDLTVHGFSGFIKILKSDFKNDGINKAVNSLENLYNELFSSFYSENDYQNLLSPIFIYKIMDNYAGIYYYNIICKLMAHNIYKYFSNQNIVNDFISCITNKNSIFETHNYIVNKYNLNSELINIIKVNNKEINYENNISSKPSNKLEDSKSKKKIADNYINNFTEA